MNVRKDQSLDELARSGNVAQFVSFSPDLGAGLAQTFSRVQQYPPNHRFSSTSEAVHTLLAQSPERSINLRSFTPAEPRSREFLYGLTDAESAIAKLDKFLREGLFVIANETVNTSDGGVSGVVDGATMEFAPDDTPRCVEKPGTVSIKTEDGLSLLQTVYGFRPDIPAYHQQRIEFSVHPRPRGFKGTHTLLWERGPGSSSEHEPSLSWPNRFSRMIGDKAFGLLVADLIGVPVPRSLVIGRRLRPFSFGRETGSLESWTRTCPAEQNPGLYTTESRWIDPFMLLATEDPGHTAIASVISQAAVPACYSGAAITKSNDQLHVEGTRGGGVDFMLGTARPEQLPQHIIDDLLNTNKSLRARLGPVRFEWVHDGSLAWIVQLHKGQTASTSTTVVPGEASTWTTFQSARGLQALRDLLDSLPPCEGLVLEGEIGLTSHIADLARKSGRPTRIVRNAHGPSQSFLFEMDP